MNYDDWVAYSISDNSLRGRRIGQRVIIVRNLRKGEMVLECIRGLNLREAGLYMRDKLYKLMKKDEQNE